MLFIHGAGGYLDDRPLAEGLADATDGALLLPHLPDDDMSVETWARVVRDSVTESGTRIVVAHSFGASILLHVLAQQDWPISAAILLAMPDWSPAGWDSPDYAFDGPEPSVPISLHHCRDDEIVSFSHLASHAARLPSARVVEHIAGGHQFGGAQSAIVADIETYSY
ncbi:alpha/beta hydrolase [Gordonia sp. CPCC 205333]|uniref:alpha/beta hydrolase n=1 Tax=Gordonia sp. CPCC 205333 TaxID=3140790 RepID=UPI003AF40205